MDSVFVVICGKTAQVVNVLRVQIADLLYEIITKILFCKTNFGPKNRIEKKLIHILYSKNIN